MAAGDVCKIALRRNDSGHPWGFRMQGGSEHGMPLYVAQLNPKMIAAKLGVMPGDGVLQIDGASTQGWSHAQAKQAMLRGGNEVDLVVQRGLVNVQAAPQEAAPAGSAELDEGSIDPHMNEGSKYRNVMPKSYKMLEQQLSGGGPPSVFGKKKAAAPAPAPAQAAAAASGAKPSSIFDRQKQDRSDYLQAQGQTIQRAYGESDM